MITCILHEESRLLDFQGYIFVSFGNDFKFFCFSLFVSCIILLCLILLFHLLCFCRGFLKFNELQFFFCEVILIMVVHCDLDLLYL